ncbi:MAG: STAS domain-containing protein [Lachnospiraceae bacterium]|nr:STAS domain-containing protein [Lachnospiraceae bacterium]MBR2529512.1 STAS domain-containing protein [Lachnospiraceae bacterium]
MLNISKEANEGTLKLELEGRLDTVTAPQLEEALKDSTASVKELVFDLTKLEYISSAGLRVLLSMQKIMNKQGEMKILGANDNIMEIFEVTGFVDILNIEK